MLDATIQHIERIHFLTSKEIEVNLEKRVNQMLDKVDGFTARIPSKTLKAFLDHKEFTTLPNWQQSLVYNCLEYRSRREA